MPSRRAAHNLGWQRMATRAWNRPGARRATMGPWDLSAGRAINIREILAQNGLPDDRFANVAGKADTDPMFPDNPYLAANRRVTITLLNEAPPLPFDQKP